MAVIHPGNGSGRPLTLGEKFIAALTAALAVATLALAVATSARAVPAGVLPGERPYFGVPTTAISHAEDTPVEVVAPPKP